MTSETRTFIDPGDISGIEVECPECHLTVFYPIGGERTMDIWVACAHCMHRFFDKAGKEGSNNYPAINELQKIVSALRALLRPERTDIHTNVRFRITNPS